MIIFHLRSVMSVPLLAVEGPSMLSTLLGHVLGAIVFAAIGVLAFGACLWIVNRLCPFSLRKEIEEDQNNALAIIIGSLIIGIAIIIAAAVQG